MGKKIIYLSGDATQPVGDGLKIICHVCNDIGAWGAGFVLALSSKWEAPEREYRAKTDYILGTVDIIKVDENVRVANMIGQHGCGLDENGNSPVRYGAIRTALSIVNDYAFRNNATLHMPKIGSGLAGGDWNKIEKIIEQVISVDTYVYNFN